MKDLNLEGVKNKLKEVSALDKVKTVGNIFKASYDLANQNPAVYSPISKLIIFAFLDIIVLIYFLLGVFEVVALPLYGLGLLVFLFLTFIYKYFFNAKMEMRLSWILYQTLLGENPSPKEAKSFVKEHNWKRIQIAFADMFFNKIKTGRKKKSQGFIGMISKMILGMIGEAWRFVNHFLISAMVIEELGLKDAVSKLKEIKGNVAEGVGGFFAIDVVLLAFKNFVRIIDVLFILAGFGLTSLLDAEIFVFLGFGMAFLTDSILLSFDKIVKVAYYTVFYTYLTRADEISEHKTSEAINYLKLEK